MGKERIKIEKGANGMKRAMKIEKKLCGQKILALAEYICATVLMFTVCIFANCMESQAAELLYSGKSGDLNWSIDSEGLLMIEGTGDYELDFEEGEIPAWIDYKDEIVKAVVKVDGITSTARMFLDCRYLVSVDVTDLDTSQVTNMSEMFKNCMSLSSLNVSEFNTSQVTNMSNMFYWCLKLQSLDVSGFNTSQVTNMSGLFSCCIGLSSLDVSGFDTSRVVDMSYIFWGCSDLTFLDVSGFDTSQVVDMWGMFGGCGSLTSIDVSGFETSHVTNMLCMFEDCSSLKSLDISGFDTSHVTGMKSMFEGCSNLTSLDISGFDTSQVDDMWGMFSRCSNLTNLDISGFDTSQVIMMGNMFYNCSCLISITTPTNLKEAVELPVVENYIWQDSNGVACTTVHANLTTPMTYTRVSSATTGNTPQEPEIPEDMDTPKEPEIPEDTDTPKEPEIPEDTDTPKEPEIPEDTDTPKEPEIPDDTDTPKEPEIPDDTDITEKPEMPNDKDILDTPEDSYTPQQPTESLSFEEQVYQINLKLYNEAPTDAETLKYYLEEDVPEDIKNKAIEITASCITDMEKLQVIHDWVANNIYYDYCGLENNTEVYLSHEVFEKKGTICQGYSNLTASMCRAVGIPCKIIQGFALGCSSDEWTQDVIDSNLTNHAWNEAYVDGRWMILDTTWDSVNKNTTDNPTPVWGKCEQKYFDPTLEEFSKNHKIVKIDVTNVDINSGDKVDKNLKLDISVVDNKVVFDWNTIEGAIGYELQYNVVDGDAYGIAYKTGSFSCDPTVNPHYEEFIGYYHNCWPMYFRLRMEKNDGTVWYSERIEFKPDYTVTFMDGEIVVSTETVAAGDSANPPMLEKEGYDLSWDSNSYMEVSENAIVRAVWISQTEPQQPSANNITLRPLEITSVSASVNCIWFEWKSDPKATGFEIQYSVNADLSNSENGYWKGGYKRYRLDGLLEGTTYYYRIRAYRKGSGDTFEYSEWTAVMSKQTTVKTVVEIKPQNVSAPKIKLKNVKSTKKKQMKVSWKDNTIANGYQISYSRYKSFSNAKTKNINNWYTNSMTIKGLSKGKIYYVRVRAFVKDSNGKKVYGGWSGIKKVKIMK